MLSFVWFYLIYFIYCFGSEPDPWDSGYGIFDSNWNSKRRTLEEMDQEIGRIYDMGMKIVIVKYAVQERVGETSNIYYTSELEWASGYEIWGDHISNILASAKSRGMEVYVGLYADGIGGTPPVGEKWFEKGEDIIDSYFTRQASRAIEVFDELHSIFSPEYSDTIKGWYIPHEISRYYWELEEQQVRFISLMLKPISDHLHASNNQKLIVSPFYNMELNTVEEEGLFWDSMFNESKGWNLDILAVQDGIGSSGDHIDLANLPNWLETIMTSCINAGVEFWVNVELFQDSTINPHTLDTIKSQIEIANKYAKKVISYDYSTLEEDSSECTMNSRYTDMVTKYEEYVQYVEPFVSLRGCLEYKGWNIEDCGDNWYCSDDNDSPCISTTGESCNFEDVCSNCDSRICICSANDIEVKVCKIVEEDEDDSFGKSLGISGFVFLVFVVCFFL